MEDIEREVSSSGNSFMNHMLKFDVDTKTELLNAGQYFLLSLIPLALLIHFIENSMPELDDSKSNLTMLSEVIIHMVLLFLSIYLVNRLINYIPTYSGKCYTELNLIMIVIGLLLSTSKIQQKLKTLTNRVEEMWNGKEEPEQNSKENNGKNVVKVSQPITGMKQPQPTHQASRADYLNQHNQMTATDNQANMIMNNGSSNDMYDNAGFNGLQNAGMPEPEAFNVMGGGFSSF